SSSPSGGAIAVGPLVATSRSVTVSLVLVELSRLDHTPNARFATLASTSQPARTHVGPQRPPVEVLRQPCRYLRASGGYCLSQACFPAHCRTMLAQRSASETCVVSPLPMAMSRGPGRSLLS